MLNTNDRLFMKKLIVIPLYILYCFTSIVQAQYTPVSNIKTPNNSVVQDCGVFTGTDFSYNQNQLNAMAISLYNNYNGAELIAAPTKKYNCHAYAWHIVEGGSNVWMGLSINPTSIYWTDNSYIVAPYQPNNLLPINKIVSKKFAYFHRFLYLCGIKTGKLC